MHGGAPATTRRREAEPDVRHVACRERTARASAARHQCLRRDAQAQAVRTALPASCGASAAWQRVGAPVDRCTPRELLLSKSALPATRAPTRRARIPVLVSHLHSVCSRPTGVFVSSSAVVQHISVKKRSKKGPKFFRLRRARGALRAVQKGATHPPLITVSADRAQSSRLQELQRVRQRRTKCAAMSRSLI